MSSRDDFNRGYLMALRECLEYHERQMAEHKSGAGMSLNEAIQGENFHRAEVRRLRARIAEIQ